MKREVIFNNTYCPSYNLIFCEKVADSKTYVHLWPFSKFYSDTDYIEGHSGDAR